MFYQNAQLNINMLEAARLKKVERFLCVSTVGVYPEDCMIPIREDHGLMGNPEESGFGYGWAKRLAEVHAQSYHRQYQTKVAIVRPFNVYGPRDDFNVDTGGVIPAQICKIVEASDKVIIWGNGEATRSFTFVEDVVEGMMLAVEKYPNAVPFNVASNEEIKIKDLVQLIIDLSNKNVQIEFDLSKPSGAQRRCADIGRAQRLLTYNPHVTLREGLIKTIEWYVKNRPSR